jgi:hypothetical protein
VPSALTNQKGCLELSGVPRNKPFLVAASVADYGPGMAMVAPFDEPFEAPSRATLIPLAQIFVFMASTSDDPTGENPTDTRKAPFVDFRVCAEAPTEPPIAGDVCKPLAGASVTLEPFRPRPYYARALRALADDEGPVNPSVQGLQRVAIDLDFRPCQLDERDATYPRPRFGQVLASCADQRVGQLTSRARRVVGERPLERRERAGRASHRAIAIRDVVERHRMRPGGVRTHERDARLVPALLARERGADPKGFPRFGHDRFGLTAIGGRAGRLFGLDGSRVRHHGAQRGEDDRSARHLRRAVLLAGPWAWSAPDGPSTVPPGPARPPVSRWQRAQASAGLRRPGRSAP